MAGLIDQDTVNRILDAADIVDVVSDFVKLKRRGVNYIGLCPFHNDRTPSFSVSPSKGLCKCFSCGKGGSPVGFLMELEQMSYGEALRYLAKKYNIEIKERELTDAEREAKDNRESMLAINQSHSNSLRAISLRSPTGKRLAYPTFASAALVTLRLSDFISVMHSTGVTHC